jgi:glycosyltransferase involved in cell wall biosynthesis
VDASLIICTRNRSSQLARTLAEVDKLATDLRWELIVVDNGSSDDTMRVLDAYGATGTTQLVVVCESKAGLSRARNAGIKASSGQLVVFIDDDCYPAADLLTQVSECFAGAPQTLGFVGGRVLLYDATDLPMTIQTSMESRQLKGKTFIGAGLIHGANMAFRRSALIDVGDFDIRLGPGTPFVCDDVDILGRLLSRGWDGVYDPRPLVWHHHGRKTPSEAAALGKAYDAGRGAYYAKCLLRPNLRYLCARHWYRSLSLAHPTRMRREIGAAIHYLTSTGVLWLRNHVGRSIEGQPFSSAWSN